MTDTTTPTIEELEAAVHDATVAVNQLHGDHFNAYNALFDAHNAAVQTMNADYAVNMRELQQTLAAAQKALDDALEAQEPTPEAGE